MTFDGSRRRRDVAPITGGFLLAAPGDVVHFAGHSQCSAAPTGVAGGSRRRPQAAVASPPAPGVLNCAKRRRPPLAGRSAPRGPPFGRQRISARRGWELGTISSTTRARRSRRRAIAPSPPEASAPDALHDAHRGHRTAAAPRSYWFHDSASQPLPRRSSPSATARRVAPGAERVPVRRLVDGKP